MVFPDPTSASPPIPCPGVRMDVPRSVEGQANAASPFPRCSLSRSLSLPRELPKQLSAELHLAKGLLQERLRCRAMARPATVYHTISTQKSSHPAPRSHRFRLTPGPAQRRADYLSHASFLSSLPLSSPPPHRTIASSSVVLLTLLLLTLLSVAPQAPAATIQWTGNGKVADFNDANNWQGNAVPVSGVDSVIFSGAPSAFITNALNNYQLNGITFDTTAVFNFQGGTNKLTLGGDIIDYSRNHTQSINYALTFTATHTVDVEYGAAVSLNQIVDLTGSAGLIKTGAGLLTLGGSSNSIHGLTIQGGTVSIGADGVLGSTANAVVLDGGALRLTGSGLNATISSARTIQVGPNGGTIDAGNGSFAGSITDAPGGSGSFTKTGGDPTGSNLFTLSGLNTYTGDTFVNQGTLKLDFTNLGTSQTSNILYHNVTAGQLHLGGPPTRLNNINLLTAGGNNSAGGGGILMLQSANGAADNQTFNGLELDQGNNQIKTLASGSGTGTMTVNLGAITRNEGGMISFSPNTGDTIKTTNTNINGILGAYAIINTAAGSDWAAVNGSGNIIPYSGYITLAAATITSNAASNIRISSSTASGNISIDTGTVTDVNTIQVTDANARTIQIDNGKILRLGSSGGIWRSAAGTSTATITIGVAGTTGILTAGGADNTSGEIVLRGRIGESTNTPSNSFIINSIIADNGPNGFVRLVVTGTAPDDGINDTGAVVLNAANTYSDGTYVNSGVVIANDPGSFGSGLVNVMPGAQVILNTANTTNDFFIAGNTTSSAWNATTHAALRAGSVLGSSTSVIGLTGDSAIGLTGSSSLINSQITGGYSVTFEGNGTASPGVITLNNYSSDYTGNTYIGKVTLRPGAAFNSGTGQNVIPYGAGYGDVIFVGNFGTLDLNGRNLAINGLSTTTTPTSTSSIVTNSGATGVAFLSLGYSNGTATFNGTIQDGATALVGLMKEGTGIQFLGGVSTYTGDTIIDNGVLEATSNTAFSSHSAVKFNSTTGILRLNGKDNAIDGLSSALGNGIVENNSYNSGTNILTIGSNNGNGSYGGALRDGAGVGPLGITKVGLGTQILTGTNNTYTGPTTVTTGTLEFDGGSNPGVNSAVTVGTNGHLVTQGDLNIGSLSGSGEVRLTSPTPTSATLSVGGLNVDSTYSGAINDDGAGGNGVLGVTKVGSGTQTLSGASTYTGPTTVNAGTLNVSGTIKSNVIINAGARFAYNNTTTPFTNNVAFNGTPSQHAVLGGSGLFNVSLSLTSKNSTLSPGNSPGVMTFMTSQLWNSFTYDWETNNFHLQTPGTNFDQIQIQGGLTLSGGANAYQLNLFSLAADNSRNPLTDFTEQNRTWTILTTTTGINGFDPSNWTLDASGFTASPDNPTGTFAVQKSADGKSLEVTYTAAAAPEPSSAILILALGLIGILKKRR